MPQIVRRGDNGDVTRPQWSGRHPSNLERQVVLTTRSIVVTTWLPDDVEDLHELHPDPLTMRFTGPWRPESRRVRCPFYVYAYESQL